MKKTKQLIKMEKEEMKKYFRRFQEIDNQGLQGIVKDLKRGLKYLITFPYWLIVIPIFKLLVLGAYQVKYGLRRNPGMWWTITTGTLLVIIVVLFVNLRITKTGIENRIDENSSRVIDSQKAFWYRQGYEEAKKTVDADIPDNTKKVVESDNESKTKKSTKKRKRKEDSSIKKSEDKKPDEPIKKTEEDTKKKPETEDNSTND